MNTLSSSYGIQVTMQVNYFNSIFVQILISSVHSFHNLCMHAELGGTLVHKCLTG